MPHYLTPQQAADSLKLRTVKTIYNYLSRGEFPHAKKRPGGWMIPESDIAEFLERWTPKE